MQFKDFPTVFRNRIDETGMTDKAVAEKAGLTREALSAMLNHRQKITATAFIGLCAVLGLTVDDFIITEKEGE